MYLGGPGLCRGASGLVLTLLTVSSRLGPGPGAGEGEATGEGEGAGATSLAACGISLLISVSSRARSLLSGVLWASNLGPGLYCGMLMEEETSCSLAT